MDAQRGLDIGHAGQSRSILWIHGYTGSPGSFAPLLERLSRSLDAHIVAPLLPGHGTEEHDLIGLGYEDFLDAARSAAATLVRDKKPLTIVGYSFGGYLSAELAHEFKPAALVMALTPYAVRFPCNTPYIERFFRMKQFWDKCLTREDIREREGTFYYPDVPGTSLTLVKHGNTRLAELLPHIDCPLLTIHNTGDPLAASHSGEAILAASAHHPHSESHVLPHGRHALFFRPEHEREEKILIDFLQKCT